MRTHTFRATLAALFLPLVAAQTAGDGTLTLQPQSKLWVNGTSTVRSFKCEAGSLDARVVTVAPGAVRSVVDGAKAVNSAELDVPAKALDCRNGTMNEHMLKALKAREHATITFKVASYDVSTVDGAVRGTLTGTLTLGGTQRTITLAASGVVLRGSGSGADGTPASTIRMTGRPHLAIAVRAPRGGAAGRQGADFKPAETSVADAYVPSGASSFTVSDASGFAAGDCVAIRRPVTPAWVKFMQMDDLVRDGRPQTWIRDSNITTERRIAAVSGNRITLDVPLSDSFDSKYLNPPGTAVVKIAPPARLSQAGVERLRVECPPQEIAHTQPHHTALRMSGQDCWARDVVAEETMNSVAVGGRRITLQRVSVVRKARHQGSSRPAEFAPNGTQVLLDRCSVTADNVWFAATGAGVSGPVVLLHCTFTGVGRAESHQRWSTGMLYDNCRAPEGGLDFRNRGSMGSGHGWSMGWGVAWNCVADTYVIQQPPGAYNWMIGCVGRSDPKPRPFAREPNLAEGTKDSHGTAVTPQSLYLAQLAERLGQKAVSNIGY